MNNILKTYRIVVKGFDNLDTFYAAPTRGKAHSLCYAAIKEAGYSVEWTDIKVTRVPELDDLAKEESNPRNLGFIENGVWFGDVKFWRMEAEGAERHYC